MINKKTLFAKLFLTLNLFFLVNGNAVFAEENSSDTVGTPKNWTTPRVQLSAAGLFRVSIRSNLNPLVVNRIHSWTVHVETPDGKAVEEANILVSGGMPAHKHGFPTTPRITGYSGSGNYLLEGVKFSMPGPWVMHLKITASGKSDSIKFDITL